MGELLRFANRELASASAQSRRIRAAEPKSSHDFTVSSLEANQPGGIIRQVNSCCEIVSKPFQERDGQGTSVV